MFSLRYGKRPVVEESQKISAAICVRNYLFERPIPIGSQKIDLNNEEDVKRLINEIESGTTFNLKQQNGVNTDFTEPNRVKLTYSKSNLGKGFVFWFICNICGRRVKYLYFPQTLQSWPVEVATGWYMINRTNAKDIDVL